MTISIFEYLTTENPLVEHQAEPVPDSGRHHYFRPKRLQPWTEFNMATFRQMYDQKLMQEAHRRDYSFPPVLIFDHERKVHDEKTTEYLILQWSLIMTKWALHAVRHELHPAAWSAETRQRNKKGIKLVADYATIALCGVCQDRDIRSYWNTRERLPKEIKPYPKFSSARVLARLNNDGSWNPTLRHQGEDSPVRQAYTYCVNAGCRYGCILSAYEAFIFRISPLNGPEDGQGHSPAVMKRILRSQGLMEYVVVPWRNHRTGDSLNYNELTVNFSLWVLHVLAGNKHEVDWEYLPLAQETLVQQPCPPLDPRSETPGTTEAEETSLFDEIIPEMPRTPPRATEAEETSLPGAAIPETPKTPPPTATTPSRKRTRASQNLSDAAFSFRSEPLPAVERRTDLGYLDVGSPTDEEEEEDVRKHPNYAATQDEDSTAEEVVSSSKRPARKQHAPSTPAAGRKRARRNPIITPEGTS